MEGARAATPADVPRLTELARAARTELRAQRGGALWELRHAPPEPLDVRLTALLERDDAHVVAGTIDESVVGLAVVELEWLSDGRRLGVVTELFVEPEARGVGVGEALALEVEGFCRGVDCTGVDAPALPGHRDTKNFFERSGFTARLLVMHRRLDADAAPVPPPDAT